MSARLRNLLINLATIAGSLVFALATAELVVFRYILVPDDLLPNVTVDGVVRYQPGTRAVMRHPDGSATRVTINAQGWNSTKPSYTKAKTPGRLRVAVIGDSYVHGAFVNVEQAFPELMEIELGKAGIDAEVLRFGMDGAPLSQYLHMLKTEVLAYAPDIVVVPLIHNDFDESYRFLKTRYASAFMKLQSDASGLVTEVAPAPFKPSMADRLRGFATFRYLYYETNLYLHAKQWVSRYFWGGEEDWKPEFISSAVDIRKIADHDKNRFFARYVLSEMKRLAQKDGFKLAFVMDGVRESIYQDRPVSEFEVSKLNRIADDLTRELDLPFLDLQATFAADFAKHRARFEYAYDWHWNARANKLVADAVTKQLLNDPRIALSARRLRADSAQLRSR